MHPVYKHIGECGTEIPDERLITGEGGALANVLVHTVEAVPGPPIDTEKHLVLDNRQCIFVPHVLSASRGQTLSIRNSDPFLHDAHAWLGTRTLFNVALPKGKTVNKVLTDPGLIQINCNVRHTWMRAYVFVAENPYHAVTDRDGRFEINGLPPGTYTLRFWHELLGNTDRSVTVTAGHTAHLDVGLRSVAPEVGAD
jgi:plastocyanin